MIDIKEFWKCFRADVCIFLHKNIWVSLTSAVRVLLRDYICTPRLFKDVWLLLNIAVVHS